jgi:pilus assembly protein CpaD
MTRTIPVIKTSSALALIAAFGLTACASGSRDASIGPITPTEHYAIEVNKQPQQIQLAIHRDGVSQNQAAALAAFAQDWASSPESEVTVRAPTQPSDPAATYRTATDIRDVLIAHGVAPSKVQIVGYDANADPHAPILVAFDRYVAQIPHCNQSWANLSDTFTNQEDKNFGCAVTANMAAQIADPRDVVSPRASTPSAATRRQAVMDHYVKGEVTSTAADTQANGAVSSAIH